VRLVRLHDRPRSFRWAIYLMVADALVGLLVLVFGSGIPVLAPVIVFLVALQLVQLALVFAIAVGRRWAFVVYGLWFLYDVVHVSLNLHTYLGHALNFTWVAATLVVEAVAIVLLLTPRARAEFASAPTTL
jgi:hypothetical protein